MSREELLKKFDVKKGTFSTEKGTSITGLSVVPLSQAVDVLNRELEKQKEEIAAKAHLITEACLSKQKDEIRDMLIDSLPPDAENLSTLTGWQAQAVVKNFLEKLNK